MVIWTALKCPMTYFYIWMVNPPHGGFTAYADFVGRGRPCRACLEMSRHLGKVYNAVFYYPELLTTPE
jgi:hypothetical protein